MGGWKKGILEIKIIPSGIIWYPSLGVLSTAKVNIPREKINRGAHCGTIIDSAVLLIR